MIFPWPMVKAIPKIYKHKVKLYCYKVACAASLLYQTIRAHRPDKLLPSLG